MAKLWRRARDENGKPRVDEVDLSSFKITAPTVLYLSGFMTTDKQKGYVSGAIRDIEEMLWNREDLSPPPQIYAWSHSSLANVFNVAAYNYRPNSACCADTARLVTGVIMPLVSDNGQPVAFEEAQKRLRNLTLFGYSSGTVVAQEIFNDTLKKMRKIGYDKDEAHLLLKEVVLVSAGNISRPTKEKNRFTTLYLVASNDLIVRLKNRLWRPLATLFKRYARRLTIRTLSEASLLITAAARKKLWHWKTPPEGDKVKKKIEPLIPRALLMHSKHELPHYMTNDDEHSYFSKIVLHALVNAASRKATTAPLQLLEPVALRTPEEATAYRARITKAMV